jgi:AcrR family transcriptional regulator
VAATREFSQSPAHPAGVSEPLYAKLKPGPGRPASEVAAHQSARIRSAMVELVAERGYDAVTARELARVSGVSTRAFYKHFDGKEDCFLSTHELVVRRAAKRIIASQAGERDWLERLRLAFGAFARELEREPRAARLALVDAYETCPAALEQARRAESIFAAMIAESFTRAGDGIVLSPLLVEGLVSGIVQVSRAQVTEGEPEELAYFGDRLMDWLLCYRCDGVAILDTLNSLSRPGGSPSGMLSSQARNGEPAVRMPAGDRALIILAVTKLVVAHGYDHLTVARIRSAAGVSHRAFKAHFDGVEDCFLAALDQRLGEALSEAAARELDSGGNWGGGVYRTATALCTRLAEDPLLAGLCGVDVPTAGHHDRLVVAMEGSGQAAPASPWLLDALAHEASLSAAWSLLQRYGSSPQLHRLGATLTFLVVAPVLGPTATINAIRNEALGFTEP